MKQRRKTRGGGVKPGGWCVDEDSVMFSGEESWPSDFQMGSSVPNREYMWLKQTQLSPRHWPTSCFFFLRPSVVF